MNKLSILILLMLSGIAVQAQRARIIKFPELQNIMNAKGDTTYVINFWATWCTPCVKELPYFNQLEKSYAGKKIKVFLVSLDFKRQFETQLIPYLKKNGVDSEVVLIDEPDYNSWIDKVDPSWGGAIPATLIVNSSLGIHNFYEKDFTLEELNNVVKPLLP